MEVRASNMSSESLDATIANDEDVYMDSKGLYYAGQIKSSTDTSVTHLTSVICHEVASTNSDRLSAEWKRGVENMTKGNAESTMYKAFVIPPPKGNATFVLKEMANVCVGEQHRTVSISVVDGGGYDKVMYSVLFVEAHGIIGYTKEEVLSFEHHGKVHFMFDGSSFRISAD
eukprot:Lankesteria_metandrocarpae@DN5152_c0_g3_i2.p1